MKRRLSDEVFELFDEHQLPVQFISDMDTVIECSFLVQSSITYLNLEVGEFSNFKSGTNRPDIDNLYKEPASKCSRFDYFHDLKTIYTEEACKKLFAPYRQILYVFHLDVCKKLDHNLRTADMRNIGSCCSDNVFLNSVVIYDHDIYKTHLNKMITEAIKESHQKVKLINHLSKLMKRMRFLSKNVYMQNEGLEILCSEGAELTVLKDFLNVTNRYEGIFHLDLSTEAFKLFLHHANTAGYDLRPIFYGTDPIHSAIDYSAFQKADYVFEYLDAPRFCPHTFFGMRSKKCWLESEVALNRLRASGPMTEERCLHILQIFQVHYNCRYIGLKTLQKVWRSIPDSFITMDELTVASSRQSGMPSPEEIADICSYLKEITGEDVLEGRRRQPRKLKHYCRVSIRRVLSNNRQLSTGLDKLKCAPSLKSFLKLEK